MTREKEILLKMAKKALQDRPKGDWIPCSERLPNYAKGNYCPNCGAKMTKGGDSE